MANSNGGGGGIGVVGLLGVVFVTLKLCHVIEWSWWWVLCPFWIGLAILLAVCVGLGGVVGLAAFILTLMDKARANNRRVRSKR